MATARRVVNWVYLCHSGRERSEQTGIQQIQCLSLDAGFGAGALSWKDER
jgi:hypothetical protein